MKVSRSLAAIQRFLLALCLPGVALFATIPSCQKEMATLYPKAMTPDLSVCGASDTKFKATAPADISKFGKRLNGTWELNMRTVQGITIDTQGSLARLYFDMSPAADGKVSGAALQVEQPKEATMQRVSTPKLQALGFWEMAISLKNKMSLSLGMSEGASGFYESPAVTALKEADFAELQNTFVSINKAPKSEGWDRVILGDNVLLYVSCRRGIIERYVRVSSETPQVDGMPVKAYWQKLKGQAPVRKGE